MLNVREFFIEVKRVFERVLMVSYYQTSTIKKMSNNKSTFGSMDPKCSRHPSQMPSALSSTILDYYHKYGRNRDLEKYLRFRNRSSSGNSSIQLSPIDDRIGKSMENINILESCLEPEKNIPKSKSTDSLNKSGHLNSDRLMEKSKSKSPIADKQIKLTATKSVKSKKKYNINMDTSIEITLPQQLPQPSYQQQQAPKQFNPILTQHDFAQQKIEFGTIETQTEQIEYPKTPNQSEFDVVEIPARPSSVASSAASVSNKQRLEWDSMADVGYYKSTESSNLTNLTEFERKALKKFFASRGVSFDDEMVVFANKSKLSNSVPELTKQAEKARTREKWEFAFQKILEEKYAKRNEKCKDQKVDDRKRLWQSALVKFREKYGTHFNPESDLCITEPAVHSTPILSDSSKGAIPKVKSKLLDTKSQTDNVQKLRIAQVEKACQTSMVTTSSKECQVDGTASDVYSATDYQGVSSTDNSKESEKSSDCKEGLISATSFEFIAPNLYHGQDKENVPPCKKDKDVPLPKAEEFQEEENKENVPPRELDDDEIVEKFHLSTPKNTTTDSSHIDEMFGGVSTLENDLTKGVEVLYSLANSKELTEEKKKKLVRKIIKRITSAKYKDSTASSESIVSSSCDSEKSKSVVGNANSKPNISGINTLSSTSSSNSNKESSDVKVKSSVERSNAEESSIKDWLKPITNSEVQHEKNKSKDNEVKRKLPETDSERRLSKNSNKSDVSSQCDSNILKFVEKQRQTQFEWIDKEICHLVSLKEYLKKKRESDIMKDVVNLEMHRNDSSLAGKSKDNDVIYENVISYPEKAAKNNYAEVKMHRFFSDGKTFSFETTITFHTEIFFSLPRPHQY